MPLPEHWSVSVEWRPGRWDPMSNAPAMDAPLTEIRVRDAQGRIYEPVHWAQGGGEEQPPFRGWFRPAGSGYQEVDAVEWQPLRAAPTDGFQASPMIDATDLNGPATLQYGQQNGKPEGGNR